MSEKNIIKNTSISEVNHQKRRTLKGAVAVTAGAAIGTIPAIVTADLNLPTDRKVRQVWPPVKSKNQIGVSTQVSSITNDLEIVLTNQGDEISTLTQLTPATITTPRGSFDLAEVTSHGSRKIKPGQSIRIPLRRHTVVLDGKSIVERKQSLSKTLNTQLTLVTDANVFAASSYANVSV